MTLFKNLITVGGLITAGYLIAHASALGTIYLIVDAAIFAYGGLKK